MNLMKAANELMTRPADESFTTLQAMHAAAVRYFERAREIASVALASLRPIVHDGKVKLVGKGETPVALNYWSAGQLAERANAPAGYINTLSPDLAVANLSYGLAKRVSEEPSATVNMLCELNADKTAFETVRSINGSKYSRFWNYECTQRLLDLEASGLFEVARPDINGDTGQRPLYVSSHDMFAFMRSAQTISEPGNRDGLRRGVIFTNSEVGAGKLKAIFFLYRVMCANHIIWNVSELREVGIVHVGDIHAKASKFRVQIAEYLNSSATETEARIANLKNRFIAADKDAVLDIVFGKRINGLTRKALDAGYDATIADVDGSPKSAWGLAQGLTRYSQTIEYADQRTAIDTAAGKLLSAF